MLPSDPKARKRIPLATGLLDYFPDALADVAGLSLVANEQHNPGEPLHWSRHKSNDHDDCLMRHFMERGTVDSDGIRHWAKVAWRALAALQLEIEAAREREEAAERRRVAAEAFRDPNFWDWSAHPDGPPRPQAYDAHPFNPVAAEEASPRRQTLPIRDAVVGQVYGGGCIQGKPGPVPLNLPSDADGS